MSSQTQYEKIMHNFVLKHFQFFIFVFSQMFKNMQKERCCMNTRIIHTLNVEWLLQILMHFRHKICAWCIFKTKYSIRTWKVCIFAIYKKYSIIHKYSEFMFTRLTRIRKICRLAKDLLFLGISL